VPAGFAVGLKQRHSKDVDSFASSVPRASGDEHPYANELANTSPDAKMTDWYDCPPLHFACHQGFAGVILQLLQHGGNPWISILVGDATKLAKNAGHKELVAFFDELAVVVFKALNVDEKALEEMRNPPLWTKLTEIL